MNRIIFLVLISLIFHFGVQAKNKPTVFTIGDSTVKNGKGNGAGDLWGWGDPIAQYFDTTKVAVINHALGGTSSRTFQTRGLWKEVLDQLKKGDFVLMQFGHNDGSALNDDSRARGTIKGVGEETEEIDNILTKEQEMVHSYGWYLRKMVREAKAKGATPIIITPIPRNDWENGRIKRTPESYPAWAMEIARQEGIMSIDLNKSLSESLDNLGEEKVTGTFFYPHDHTHTSAKGAKLAASLVVSGIKANPELKLNRYLLKEPKINFPVKKRIFIIGDSTVANGNDSIVGWGRELPAMFDTSRVVIVNKARGGRSSRTFHTEGLWDEILPQLQKGDFVLMQFGHNDGARPDAEKFRGSLPGTGNETQEVTKPDGTKEKVYTFGWYMKKFISETKAKGAVPIVLSMIPRNSWKDAKVELANETYGKWAKEVAEQNSAFFIDLNELVAIKYEGLGAEKVKAFFPGDHTHTDSSGAKLNAETVGQGIRGLKDCELKAYLKDKDQRQAEYLSRGVVALQAGRDSVMVSWRLLYSDADNVEFNVYRQFGNSKAVKLNAKPLSVATSMMDLSPLANGLYTYTIKPVNGGEEGVYVLNKKNEVQSWLTIPLQTPDKYTPGDIAPGDLDGDGDYELVVHMTGVGRDNSHQGMTDAPIFQAYKMDGTLLWSINLGKNIREGAHYTQFLVYDFDGDGRAEVVMKTADGTTDGKGKVIGDATADHQNGEGHIVRGPEFLTLFDGLTGAALATVNYPAPRHPTKENPTPDEMEDIWGDGNANRSERYLACVAYLDGVHPSMVMCRGYYTRATLAAFDWRDGKLTQRWLFDSDDNTPGNRDYRGQGNHSVSVGDVDGDGCDEIIYGAAVIDNDGKGLYSTGLGHADALHLSDLDPSRPGLEVFNIQERFSDAGLNFRDAKTGEILWRVASLKADESGGDRGEGPGRGVSFNVDPRYPGNECWVFGAQLNGMWNAQGKKIAETNPSTYNFAVWWDGDLLRELLDKNQVMKWDWNTQKVIPLMTATDCTSNNGTKSTPALSADLFGDWREEVIFRTIDNQSLRIFTTTLPTKHRFVTLMQDPIYRLSVAWQNVAYNQPPHPGFYIGNEMNKPVKPNLKLVKFK